jgi:hypothetical protein
VSSSDHQKKENPIGHCELHIADRAHRHRSASLFALAVFVRRPQAEMTEQTVEIKSARGVKLLCWRQKVKRGDAWPERAHAWPKCVASSVPSGSGWVADLPSAMNNPSTLMTSP